MTTLEEASSSQDECMDDTQNEMMMTALSTGRNRNFSVARGRVHRGYSLISPHPPPTSATTTMSSSSLIEQQHRRDNRRAVVHGANSLLSSSPVSAENQCSSDEQSQQSTSSSFPTRNTPLSTTSISTSRSLSSPSLLISSSLPTITSTTTTNTSTFVINNTNNTINTTTSSTSTFSNNNNSNSSNSSKKKKSIMSSKKSSSRHSIETNDDDSHHSPLPISSSSYSSPAVYSYCSSHSNTPLISYVNNPKIHIKNTIVKNSPPSSHRTITDGCLCKINYSIQYVANNNNNNTTNHHHSNNNNNNNNKRNSMKSSNATQSSTNNNNNSSSSVATLIEQADNVNFVFGSGELSSLIEDCVHLMNGPGEMSLFICEVFDYFEPWEMDYCHRHLEPLKELLTRNSNHSHNNHNHHGSSSSSSRNSSDGSGSGSPRVQQATTTTTTNTRFHFEIVIDLKSVVSEEEQWWSFMNHGRAMHESDRMLEGVIQQKQKEAKALVMEQRYALAARQLERVFDLLESFCEATEHKYLRKKKTKMDQLAVSLLFDLANTYHMDQRVQLAIDTAGLILGMDPLNVEALVLRAHFYQTRNDLKCAMEGYIRAVDMSADEKVRSMIQNNIQTITECLGKYQVEIIGTKSEGDTTFYHIHLVNQLAGVDFKFYSRYRTMKKLYDMLAKKVPKLGQVISFPQGSWFFSNSASVINDRKEKLNQFLKYLLSSQIASQHEEARQFFIQR